MPTVFDTSAIVAALILSHPRFNWADAQVKEAAQPALCVHSLAESYAVITGQCQQA